jgi:endonuclease YncB( thermonuclease family)
MHTRPRRVLLGALIALALALPTAAHAADRPDQPRSTGSGHAAGGSYQPSWRPSQPAVDHQQAWKRKPLRLVVRVIDGDTVDVAVGRSVDRVRLIGIDTPERRQCHARQATEALTRLIGGQRLRFEADPSQGNRDRYGRLLRYARDGSGANLNRQMIRQGDAREYTYNHRNPYGYQRAFKASERKARAADLGLWGRCPTRPSHRPVASHPDRDCDDFATQRQAQAYFLRYGGSRANNVDNLDGDRDGVACEALPRS